MNWKLILQLSVFGLIMAFATVSLIPEKIEPAFWLAIFIFCAWVIAKVCNSNYFFTGFLVCMVNCIWVTAAHIAFRTTYLPHHPQAASLYANMPPSIAVHPRFAMAVTAPVFGILSGIVLGLFSVIASKVVKKNHLGGTD